MKIPAIAKKLLETSSKFCSTFYVEQNFEAKVATGLVVCCDETISTYYELKSSSLRWLEEGVMLDLSMTSSSSLDLDSNLDLDLDLEGFEDTSWEVLPLDWEFVPVERKILDWSDGSSLVEIETGSFFLSVGASKFNLGGSLPRSVLEVDGGALQSALRVLKGTTCIEVGILQDQIALQGLVLTPDEKKVRGMIAVLISAATVTV